ncbi:MAG: 5'-nucleotidase, partial [Clostridiales bacterium]|nr:5'-nucleotidase [Clostridiales bacterium]
FFDDQMVHTKAASEVVPSARVPYQHLGKGKKSND